MTAKTATSRTKKSKEAILAERRKTRGDLGSMRTVMHMPDIPGKVLRWVNDEMKSGINRVERLKSLGWVVYDGETPSVDTPTNVTEANISLGAGATLAAGTDAQGKPMQCILMMIDADIYNADQHLKEEAIQETEGTIFDLEKEVGMYGGINVGKQ